MSTDAAASTPNGSTSGPKRYTLKDLQENGTQEKMFMLLHDKVYDVTKFLDDHPGGDEVLIAEAGRDATEAFEDVGHSDEARKLLEPMLLGEFEGEKKSKAVKKAVSSSTATGTSAAPGGSIAYLIPLALLGAYLAWRLYFA